LYREPRAVMRREIGDEQVRRAGRFVTCVRSRAGMGGVRHIRGRVCHWAAWTRRASAEAILSRLGRSPATIKAYFYDPS
jgi:hypothetical protein